MPRKRKPPPDEELTRFGWLVAAMILIEVVYILYWGGAFRAL